MKKVIIAVLTAALVLSFGALSLGAEEAASANVTNVAFEKEVGAYCDKEGDVAALDSVFFKTEYLTDGEAPPFDNVEYADPDTHICWYGGSKEPETDITLIVDLDGVFDLTCVRLIPTPFLNGQNMPSDYEVGVSMDGDNWTIIGSEQGLTDVHTVHADPFEYPTTERAAYVMVHITKASCVADPNYHYSGIAAIEAMGAEVPKTPKPTKEATPEPTQDAATEQAPAATDAPAVTDAPKDDAGNNDNKDNTEKKDNKTTRIIVGAVAAAVIVAGVVVAILAGKKKK
jgi:hypothetical protein